MTSSTGGAHILVIPYPAQGHMLPLLDLTHHLLSRSSREGAAQTFTILVTTNNLPILQPLLSYHSPSAISTLVLPFPPNPSLPSGAENTQNLPPYSSISIMSSLGDLRRPILRWFSSHPSPPSSIISDMFLGWTHRLASQLSIKRFVFSPSGSFAISVFGSLWRHLPPLTRTEDGEIDINAVVPLPDVPGEPRLLWYQLSMLYRTYASGDPNAEFLRSNALDNSLSWGLVVNSFTHLEQPYLCHLKSYLGHDRIWAVGPLLPDNPDVRGGSGPIEDQVLTWLDECCSGEDEVVYVCFGSQAVLSNEQMEALALGIEKSGVRFIWKVKEPTQGHVYGERFGKLPEGFEDRVAGRGLIIRGWAPQVRILRHRAVGAFITHCGWNSVLEGLSAGTLMLTWPLGADQFCNSILLVDQLKVGVSVCQDTKSLPDPDQLARVISGSINGAYKEERLKALELKKMAAEAISEGGTSLTALDSLVQHLSMLPKPNADELQRCLQLEEEEVAAVM
uniref:UFGT41 n=1 Tax=Fagopyrum tataricum TaxID=62330 RepID=A0A385L2Z5_FAGTA|nr:UFGT41 [Fagopyrum tataricum]